mmetsp:Transcript_6050/g.12338  ORF Transcript_6050/g.12338 Transcript_6050/m.12338 type:complete len:121 (-) Transcript_6050:621-983(-)
MKQGITQGNKRVVTAAVAQESVYIGVGTIVFVIVIATVVLVVIWCVYLVLRRQQNSTATALTHTVVMLGLSKKPLAEADDFAAGLMVAAATRFAASTIFFWLAPTSTLTPTRHFPSFSFG